MQATLLETLNSFAKREMERIEEENNGYPKLRAKIQAFIAKQPEGRRDELTDVLLPRTPDGRWAQRGENGILTPLKGQGEGYVEVAEA
jgi:hypothetical protein